MRQKDGFNSKGITDHSNQSIVQLRDYTGHARPDESSRSHPLPQMRLDRPVLPRRGLQSESPLYPLGCRIAYIRMGVPHIDRQKHLKRLPVTNRSNATKHPPR